MRRKTRNRPPPGRGQARADHHNGQTPRPAPEAIETLVAMIVSGQLDAELPLLYNTIGDRMEALASTKLAMAMARLSIGDRVRIGHNVKPGYIHGQTATVIARGVETITIRLDHPIGKFANGEIRCSPLAVEPIGPE
jgi:hypothetical protein